MSGDEAIGQLSTEPGRRALLQSVVDTTRAVFSAKACSIMRHDTETHELVFEAVSGEGSGTLEGTRIPARTGLAGWSLAAEEPIAVADVGRDPRFARDVAESTGYVPKAIAVYPLLVTERAIGVLSVLDQGASERVGLADMNVLGLIANHAAALLALVMAGRSAQAGGEASALTALDRRLAALDPHRREAVLELVRAVEALL
jgi:GAF domain-containing protein